MLQYTEKGAVIYFCGLKGMMPGILEALEKSAQEKRGMNASDWKAFVQQLKANGQWHVEVY
jgi:ferredoxin--NADP+ reductase